MPALAIHFTSFGISFTAAIVTRPPAVLPVSHLLFILQCFWKGDGEAGNGPRKKIVDCGNFGLVSSIYYK
jgi:hypothetical protein